MHPGNRPRPPGVQLFAHPVQTRASDERYTPPHLFDALGLSFDVDVAAPSGGVAWVPAARYLTADDDGLAQPWDGRVWCNPPYSNAGPWADRFGGHDDGVILFPFSVNASWLHRLLAVVDPVLMLEHVKFVHPTHTGRHVPVMVALGARGPVCAAAVHAAAARLPGSLLYHAGRRNAQMCTETGDDHDRRPGEHAHDAENGDTDRGRAVVTGAPAIPGASGEDDEDAGDDQCRVGASGDVFRFGHGGFLRV